MTRAKPFADRADAGRALAERLSAYSSRSDVLVLALPRGGVVVGHAVANALGLPLDVLLVRKLGVPGREELAMGAIASGGIRVLNEDVVRELAISDDEIERATVVEAAELERRDRAYRGDRPPIDVCARTVILVDDGMATGSTMRSAVQAIRALGPARVVVAVPTAAPAALAATRQEADECVAIVTPDPFLAVGLWYVDFSQTTDDEVRELLTRVTLPLREREAPAKGAWGTP